MRTAKDSVNVPVGQACSLRRASFPPVSSLADDGTRRWKRLAGCKPALPRYNSAMKSSIVFLAAAATLLGQAPPKFKIVETTIPEMRAAMERGKLTSHDLV